MCKFLSAIGLKNGDIICDPSIDSHEDLISFNQLKKSKLRNWVRIEFYPDVDKDYADLSKYKLHLDDLEFDWTVDVMESWERKLRTKLKRIIITEDRDYLPCGIYVLGDCKIGKLTYGRVVHAGNATIKDAEDATIENAGYATIKNAGYATIKDAWHATIENAGYATIKYAENATIKYAENATIKYAGNATIENAGYATIKDAGNATIINRQNARIS